MQQLPPGFQLEGGPAPTQAPARAPGVIMGRPKAPDPSQIADDARADRTENRQEAKDSFRLMTPEEQQAAGLPEGGVYQVNGLGDIKEVSAAPKTGTPESTAQNAVVAAGIDLRAPEDRIASLILDSTSGRIQTFGANLYGDVTGESTDGMKAIGTLKPLVADLVLQATGGSLGAQISDGDRKFIIERMGNIADPEVPADQRLASWNEVKRRLANSLGVPLGEVTFVGEAQPMEGEGLEGVVVTDDSPATSAPSGGGSGGGGGGGIGPAAQAFMGGVGDIVQGVGDTVGMITDPFARVISDALGYDANQFRSLGTVTREGAGLPQSQNQTVRRINEFAAGGLVGGLAVRAAAPLAQAGTVTQNVLSTVGRTPIRDTVAGAGAGAGSSIGEQVGGAPGALIGGLAGGLGGYSAANRAMTATAPRQPNALAQAAERQNVNLLPADTGGPVASAITTGTRASPLSVGPVAGAAETQQRQFGEAVQRTARTQGEVVDTQAAGETVRKGAQDYIQRSRQMGTRLYERAEKQAKGVRAIKPTQTVAAAREALARLKQNPAATPSEVSGLESFIQTIEGGVSIQGLRDARTKLSQGVYDGGLRSSSEQAMWKGILGNVADDIDSGLRSVGREDAANTFRAADKMWSERIEVIEQTLSPIIGKDGLKGGEQVLSAIEGMARGQGGGNARLSRLLATLSPEEAGSVRATLVDRLGRATPGAQDAQGEAFSAATFLTNWNKMTPQGKASMFPDKATRDNLSDLALIAGGTKRSQAMANTSNTGVALTSANVIAGGAGAAANLPATLLVGGSVYLTGKLMASPRFAKLLAQTAKLPPQAANRRFSEQLGILATREPALQGDINSLMQAVNDNSPRLAAEEERQQ